MNDRHPSGTATPPAPASDAASAHYASYSGPDGQYGDFTTYDGYAATGFDTGHGGYAATSFAADPLFGDLQGASGAATDQTMGAATGSYDTGHWQAGDQTSATGGHQTLGYDPYAAQHQDGYDTGGYDTTAWAAGYQQLAGIPAQSQGHDGSGQWDASAWLQPEQAGPLGQAGPLDHGDHGQQDHTQQWAATQIFDTGAYDATQWNGDGGASADAFGADAFGAETYGQPAAVPFDQQATATFEQVAYDQPAPESYDQQASEPFDQQATATFEQVPYEQPAAVDDGLETAGGEHPDETQPFLLDGVEEVTDGTPAAPAPGSRAANRSASRSRRRAPAKRSALLTVAVPSACVMGVAGIAAASVVGVSGDDGKETTASEAAEKTTSTKTTTANNKLDTQLANLSADADDFADRASRTQERIDLKAQQEAQKKKAAEEAARKERLRPKFALPVAQKGLSAYYGQAGVNWMSVHTGIDFPVSYGTTVMAATDGTVRTQWNSAYGNMAIVTAKDGTETWYCHLSSYKVASGTTVKAGDPIAFSGNSGNSTGPHLHFEVRPAGGAAIDPLPWLRSHDLDPTA
ncbi:M23 family metallopeptidase [Streptomyces sp. NPDC059785]|uniref:M23 family metallopeptidase n=1 Tax=Streptomyces sp. NPDC059785 TaxID=3346945 RepID=UPI003647EE1E